MDEIVLYSTGCPKCKVIAMKLDKKGIAYTVNTDTEEMVTMGIKSAPNLKVGDKLLNFTEAVKWVNEQ